MAENRDNIQPEATSDAAALATEIRDLRQMIRHGRRRWQMFILLEAVSLAVAAPLAYLWLVFLIDNVFHLPAWGLVVANLLFLAGLFWMVRRLIVSWRRAQFSEDQVALAIEKRTAGGLENRLINALQLSRGEISGDGALAGAVIDENYRFLKAVRLQQIAESRPVVVRAGLALALVGFGVFFWATSAERFTTSAARFFMPLAGIQPVYRTTLTVEPGNVTVAAGSDVELRVRVDGRVPPQILLLIDEGNRQSSLQLDVDVETGLAAYRFEGLQRGVVYSLRGGDYRTPAYRITVPVQLELRSIEAELTYPEYSGLEPARLESSSGDLEALAGTRGRLEFTLNQTLDGAWLEVWQPENGDRSAATKRALQQIDERRYVADYEFDHSRNYVIAGRRAGDGTVHTREGRLRVRDDQPPEIVLSGIEADSEVMLEDVIGLRLRVRDDVGVEEAGIFWRPVAARDDNSSGGQWQPVRAWDVSANPATELDRDASLLLAGLAVAEGDRIEIAGRARDAAPQRQGQWTVGAVYPITVTSPGAALQLVYERILATEQAIETLIDGHEELERSASEWIVKLEPGSGLRWDDATNLRQLADAITAQAKRQAELRLRAGSVARQMPEQAGPNMPTGMGMLADTEMVRAIRQLEQVTAAETPQAKRGALADGRLTVQRTLRSLRDVHNRFVQFREDWELDHMIPFTEMLAQRQERMAEASLDYLGLDEELVAGDQRRSITRRQEVVAELSTLAGRAFSGLSRRDREVGERLAAAFREAGQGYEDEDFRSALQGAVENLSEGMWILAEGRQRESAGHLEDIYRNLRQAQADVAREALAKLEKMAERNPLAEQELAKLREGFDETNLLLEEELSLEDTMRLLEVAQNFEHEAEDIREKDRSVNYEEMYEEFFEPAPGEVDTSTHTMTDYFQPDEDVTAVDENPFRNPAQTVVQAALEDVVGELIEEAEDLKADYATFMATISKAVLDKGEIGRDTVDPLSSTGATATTGNQPPPSDDIGGAARLGRLGGRSHGTMVDDEMINRRGRAAQDGQEEVPEEEGLVQETLSGDPQEDESTGVGGKRVDDDETHFSTKDDGEWNDDMVDMLEDPQETVQIVERQDGSLPPDVAERMRREDHREDQLIERLKTVKKDFERLFLPTDHLDDLMSRLQDNLDRLRAEPTEDIFRERIELLSQLQSSIVVVHRPSTEFVQSVPRVPRLEGRILDEKATPSFPGYEEVVERYYRRLVDLEDPR